MSCDHHALLGHAPTGYRAVTCPSCGGWFVVRAITIVGCNTGRPVPRPATSLIPSNKWGWFCGESLTLERTP